MSHRVKFHLRKIVPIRNVFLRPVPLPLKKFRPKIAIFIERERFIIKTVENEEELARALKLRYDVFYRELLERRLLLGIDVDKFDFKCDHLVIIDKKKDAFIGTYRLLSTRFTKKFYSETEFHIDPIVALPHVKLELGRACIHRDYRTGSTFTLLWRGISEYMRRTGTKYLFGCSSVKTTDRREIAAIYRCLKESHLAPAALQVAPKRKFRIKDIHRLVDTITKEEVDASGALIPPLLKWYVHMGAVICGEPALDKKFKCADFLTFFDVDALSARAHRKYNL